MPLDGSAVTAADLIWIHVPGVPVVVHRNSPPRASRQNSSSTCVPLVGGPMTVVGEPFWADEGGSKSAGFPPTWHDSCPLAPRCTSMHQKTPESTQTKHSPNMLALGGGLAGVGSSRERDQVEKPATHQEA